MSRRGFTLIELLVVIAIIALLLSILMPSLQHAKKQATAVVCMSNQKQLSMAWVMYAEANDDKVVDGGPRLGGTITDTNPASPTYNQTSSTFVGEPENELGGFSNDTLDDKIRGFKKGGLWPYYEDYKLMHCPSDRRYHKAPSGAGGAIHGTMGGYRSYSIGACYSFVGYSMTTGEENHVTLKRNKITQPGDKIVWIEEADGCGYNQNTFNMWIKFDITTPPSPYAIWDPLAVWHNERSTFGYADGHADRYKWTDKEVIRMGVIEEKLIPMTNMDDYEWIRDAYIPRR